VIVDGKRYKTLKGVPQGGIISPILSNIYLNELDKFIFELKKKKDTEQTSIPNPYYIKAKSLLRKYKGAEKKQKYEELSEIKSTIRVGFKLYYMRYADD
jgi:retron-type reverse transcriptase